jgi:hypothetical protein
MKAYITTSKHTLFSARGHYTAVLVSRQDYFERGPHAFTFDTKDHPTKAQAVAAVEQWATKHGYDIVNGPDQF